MKWFTGSIGAAALILRILIPIYLFFKAKESKLPQPGWWILFGFFEPVIALMAFYVIEVLKQKSPENSSQ